MSHVDTAKQLICELRDELSAAGDSESAWKRLVDKINNVKVVLEEVGLRALPGGEEIFSELLVIESAVARNQSVTRVDRSAQSSKALLAVQEFARKATPDCTTLFEELTLQAPNPTETRAMQRRAAFSDAVSRINAELLVCDQALIEGWRFFRENGAKMYPAHKSQGYFALCDAREAALIAWRTLAQKNIISSWIQLPEAGFSNYRKTRNVLLNAELSRTLRRVSIARLRSQMLVCRSSQLEWINAQVEQDVELLNQLNSTISRLELKLKDMAGIQLVPLE